MPIVYQQAGACQYVTQPMVEKIETTSTPPVHTPLPRGETCVTGARLLGANLPKGDAIDLPTGSPVVGGVVKLKYGERRDDYHVAVILALLKTGMYVGEYNYHRDGTYGERFIPFNDVHIVGFWSE